MNNLKALAFLLLVFSGVAIFPAKVWGAYCGEIYYTQYFAACSGGRSTRDPNTGCYDCMISCNETSSRNHAGSCYSSGNNACWQTNYTVSWQDNRCYGGGKYGKGKACYASRSQPIACGSQPPPSGGGTGCGGGCASDSDCQSGLQCTLWTNPAICYGSPCGGGPPADSAPIGFHDPGDPAICYVAGWTCDADRFSQALNVDIYEGGAKIGTTTANSGNEPAVTARCGGTQPHRIVYLLGAGYKDGQPHTFSIIARGIDGNGAETGTNTQLPDGAPGVSTITCTPENVNVTGQVFNATGFTFNGLGQCNPVGGSGIKPGGGSQMGIYDWVTGTSQGSGGAINNDGTYSVNNVPSSGTKRIQLNGMTGYSFVCPSGGQYGPVTVSSPNNNGWNFIVTTILPQWGQIISGMVHAQTGATVAVPVGKYFLNDPVHGVATRLASSTFTVAPGTLSSATIWDYPDIVSPATWRYGYTAMYQRAGSPTTALPGNGNTAPATGVYFVNGNLTVSGNWSNLSGSRVVFVNGDVTINSPMTLAAGSGNFTAIIASGNMSVGSSVGHAVVAVPTSANADLTGVFLADGNWNGCTTTPCATQLVVYGSIGADVDLSGNGSVSFNRDLGAGNSTGPGVAVIWNPNLLLNVDQSLKDAVTNWKGEVAP